MRPEHGTLPRVFGAVEAGGSTFSCLVAEDPETVHARAVVPTGEPAETLERVAAFFAEHTGDGGRVSALGIAAFGPLELRRGHPGRGRMRTTPKPGWDGVDIAGRLGTGLGVPVGVDTDVNGAALGEGAWGAARGLADFAYLTVGSGIGGGAVVGGRLAGGLGHPEMGHVSVVRAAGDDYPGRCPFHGDCLEGMASGPALAERFGAPAEALPPADRERAVALLAFYLAAGIGTLVHVLAPERVVVGGGVSGLPGLFPALRDRLAASLADYPGLTEHGAPGFVVPAALGAMAGPAGALLLAAQAWEADRLR
ncbi:ROK family protein [Nocardiopsis coralliicola]